MYCWHLYIYKTIISYVKWVRSSLQSFLLKWHHDMQIWSTCCYFSGLFRQHCLAVPAGWGGGSTWELDKKLHIISVTNITIRTVSLLHWGNFCHQLGLLLVARQRHLTQGWAGQGKVDFWVICTMCGPALTSLPTHLLVVWGATVANHHAKHHSQDD